MMSVRPSLAVARFHVLAGLRTGHVAFGVMFLVSALPTVFGAEILQSESALVGSDSIVLLIRGGHIVSAVFILHLLMLMGAAAVSAPRARTDGHEPADLLETAPITPAGRFFGDMLGVFTCMLVIHLCTLPLLAFAFLFSAVAAPLFWWYETIVLMTIIFAAATESWRQRNRGPAGRAKVAGIVALVSTLVIAAFAATTRRAPFRDAAFSFVEEPTPLRWSELTREVMSPPLLLFLLFAIYVGFLGYFAFRSIRLIERRQEVS